MFGSAILDTAIGIIFVFCLLSLVASALREMIEAFLQMRAAQLERGLRELLADPDGTGATVALYAHPLISSLFRGTYNPAEQLRTGLLPSRDKSPSLKKRSLLPSYIPARNFALALMDFAVGGGKADGGSDGGLTIDKLREGIAQIPNAKLRQALIVAVDHAGGDIEKVRANIESWFNASMDRVSGWYRRHTQWVLFAIGVVMAIGLNVNTVDLARSLQNNESVRKVIVAQAQAAVERAKANPPAPGATPSPAGLDKFVCDPNGTPAWPKQSCAQMQIDHLPLPIGWNAQPVWICRTGIADFPWSAWLAAMVGWLLTAVAISLGAPFWFDLLNRLMVIRSTVKPSEKSATEAPKDPTKK